MAAGTALLAPTAPGTQIAWESKAESKLSLSTSLPFFIALFQLKSTPRGFQAKIHKTIIVPKVDL